MKRTSLVLAALAACFFARAAAASGPSAFCHTVDGNFTDCTVGPPVEEWSDIQSDSFLANNSYVYADQDPGATRLYLMYDYLLGTCPPAPNTCGSVEFDVQELGRLDHYRVEIGTCANAGFDVYVNNLKLPERLEEDIDAAMGCGPTPNEANPHQIYELSVPLILVYQPDDPRFWMSSFPAPPVFPADDFDGDTVLNLEDNCPFNVNLSQLDSDQDGQGDACEICPGNDSDDDGVADAIDNCPQYPNPGQRDSDNDGLGDRFCDSCKLGPAVNCGGVLLDSDKDTVDNENDNCPRSKFPNPGQEDVDIDGIGDVCDKCILDPTNSCTAAQECRECSPDADGDGTLDNTDNCRSAPNADQLDTDADEVGDVCDDCPADDQNNCSPAEVDGDGDGLLNESDNCPSVMNAGQDDEDFDGFGDVCDPCLADALNGCISCTAVPLPRSSGGPRAVDPGEIQSHGAVVNAKSDASTDTEPRSNCGSPDTCANDDPKVVLKYVKKKLSSELKCAKLGITPCDLSKANEIGPLSIACKNVATCQMDEALEVMLGTNSPAAMPVTEECAYAIASNGVKFVRKVVQNRTKNRDDLTPAAADSMADKITDHCPESVVSPAILGGDCDDDDDIMVRQEAIDCLVESLGRAQPLPNP